MRKYSFALGILALAFFASCEEIGPTINFEPVITDPSDTSYIVTPAPAAKDRNVYVEEFTGVSCPNCPAGHQIITSLKGQYGDRIVSVGLYKEGLNLTKPVEENSVVYTEDDFRSPMANNIDNTIYSGLASSLPIAGIDRAVHGGSILLQRQAWVSTIESRLAVSSPVNIGVVSTYNDADSTLKVKITATFTSAVNEKVYLTAGIVQDSIIDAQEDGLNIVENYQHNHVFRGLISGNVNGIELPFTNFYEAGRVFVRTININLFEKLREQSTYLNTNYIIPAHCKVFVVAHHNSPTKEVLQATEVHMK